MYLSTNIKNFTLPERFAEAATFKLPDDFYTAISNLSEKGIMLQGNVGVGKTFMVLAAMSKIAQLNEEQGQSISWRLWSVADILVEMRENFGKNADGMTAVEKARTADVLVLDDLGAEKYSEWAEAALFSIIDDRYVRMAPIIITTNLTLDEISARLGDRIASRLAHMCTTLELSGNDRRLQHV